MKCFVDDKPKNKFVAIYSDCSGCCLCYVKDYGAVYIEDNDALVPNVDWFIDAGYMWFIDLPDDLPMWSQQE